MLNGNASAMCTKVKRNTATMMFLKARFGLNEIHHRILKTTAAVFVGVSFH